METITTISFKIGFLALLYFSYLDLFKKNKIDNEPIAVFFFAGLVLAVISKNYYVLIFSLAYFLIFYWLWTKKSIGGADVKILTCIPLFNWSFGQNIILGQINFLIGLCILTFIYITIFKIQKTKKRKIAFIPIIFINFVLDYLIFWTIK